MTGALGGAVRRLGTRGARGAIGLDLASEGLRAIQLERGRQGLAVRSRVRAPWPGEPDAVLGSDEAMHTFLRASLRRGGFKGRRVVTAMPPGRVKLMALGYPGGADANEDAQRILDLVSERVREDLSALVVDYLPVRTNAEKHGEKSALVAVAKHAEVVAYLEQLRVAGMRVDALEIAPAAIRRLVDRLEGAGTSRAEAIVAIHADGTSCALLVLWGRRLLLYREVEFSEHEAVDRVTKQLDLDRNAALSLLEMHGIAAGSETAPAAGPDVAGTLREILKPELYALAEEVRRAAVHTAAKTHGAAIDGIRLLGAFGSWPGVAAFLGDLLAVEARSLDPLSGFRQGASASDGAAFATAAGLALHDLGTA